MALMFQRLARNFAKNGYFPTDSETISRIVQALSFTGSSCNVLDPCCGEGTALAEIKYYLDNLNSTPSEVRSYGIEYDEERAWHSKELLDNCIHGDLRDTLLGIRQFELLFLNPPYGDAISDKAQLNNPGIGRLRLEKEFYRRTHGMLQFGGVMVLIIPFYSLDKEFSGWISKHFTRVQAFMAPEQQFKQVVIFGVKQRASDNWANSHERGIRDRLVAIGTGDIKAEELPENWPAFGSDESNSLYCVPEALTIPKFELSRPDARQLADSTRNRSSLWSQYDMLFSKQRSQDLKRPLSDVSKWHLSLLLAAGQVCGVVRGTSGRTFIVRGDTYKGKKFTATERRGEHHVEKITTAKDVFIPSIRGLDITPNSENYGEVFVIK